MMKPSLLAFLCLMALVRPCAAATLPPLAAANLAGGVVRLPADDAGAPVVVLAGFDKASSEPCQAWEDRLWKAPNPDAHRVYTVLELEGVPGFVLPFIKSGVRSRTPRERWGRVLLARSGKAAWERALGYDPKAPDAPYLAVLDGMGNLVWRGHGAWSPGLENSVEKALRPNLP